MVTKEYSSISSMKREIKNRGLQNLNYYVAVTSAGKYKPVFYVHEAEDGNTLRSYGFLAETNPQKAAP